MPTEVAIIVAGVVMTFTVFAAALAWADYQCAKARKAGPAG